MVTAELHRENHLHNEQTCSHRHGIVWEKFKTRDTAQRTAVRAVLNAEPQRTPRLPTTVSEVPYTEVMTELSVGHTVETPNADAVGEVALGATVPMNVRVELGWVAAEQRHQGVWDIRFQVCISCKAL